MKKTSLIITIIILCSILCGCKATDYKKAQELFSNGDYDNAIVAFTLLGDYEDSISYLSSAQKEQYALACCKSLRGMCKDPTSFALYDNIYYLDRDTDDGSRDEVVYISYGAKNSYGTMLSGLAIFSNGTYVGDFEDEEDDFSSQNEYDTFVLDYKGPYLFALLKEGHEGLEEAFDVISGDKIAELLNIEMYHIN